VTPLFGSYFMAKGNGTVCPVIILSYSILCYNCLAAKSQREILLAREMQMQSSELPMGARWERTEGFWEWKWSLSDSYHNNQFYICKKINSLHGMQSTLRLQLFEAPVNKPHPMSGVLIQRNIKIIYCNILMPRK
jgi:hypothetical protein